MLAMVDLPAFAFHDLSTVYLQDFVSAWQYQGLGQQTSGMGYGAVFLAMLGALLGDNGEWTQKVFYLSLVPIGLISAYYLLGRLGIRSRVARLLGAFSYGVSPIAIGQFAGGPGQMATIAGLPLLILTTIRLTDDSGHRARYSLVLGLLLGIITSFNLYFPLIFAPIAAAIWMYGFVQNPLPNKSLRVALLFIFSFALTFLLDLPATLPVLSTAMNSQEATSSAFTGRSVQGLASDMNQCYRESKPINLLRFAGNICGVPALWELPENSHLAPFSLILPIFAFIALLLIRRDSLVKRSVLAFAGLAIFIILLVWLIHLGAASALFTRMPVLFVFRNPVKLMKFLPLTYAPLVGLVADRLQSTLYQNIHQRSTSIRSLLMIFAVLGVYAVGCLGLAVNSWTVTTGDMGLTQIFGNTFVVPPIFHQAADWLADQRNRDDSARIWWLPFDYTTQLRLWSLPARSISLPGGLNIVQGAVTDSVTNATYAAVVLNTLCMSKTDRLGALLAPANVKYVMLDLSSRQTELCKNGEAGSGFSGRQLLTLLANQTDLLETFRDQELVVFENKDFMPSISIFEHAMFVSSLSDWSKVLRSNAAPPRGLLVFGDSPAFATASLGRMTEMIQAQSPSIAGREVKNSLNRVTRVGVNEYDLQINTATPVFIVLGESYHVLWNAYYHDGQRLEHFPAFYYANGFYVDRIGDLQVRIVFSGQENRNELISVSALAWAISLLSCIVLIVKKS